MIIKLPSQTRQIFLLIGMLFVLSHASYGQKEVVIKNTVREVRPGLYECVIYIEASREVLDKIDDVRYTLPSGYPNRKQTRGPGNNRNYPFSSNPIITAEDVIVNIKIDFKGPGNYSYLSYRLNTRK